MEEAIEKVYLHFFNLRRCLFVCCDHRRILSKFYLEMFMFICLFICCEHRRILSSFILRCLYLYVYHRRILSKFYLEMFMFICLFICCEHRRILSSLILRCLYLYVYLSAVVTGGSHGTSAGSTVQDHGWKAVLTSRKDPTLLRRKQRRKLSWVYCLVKCPTKQKLMSYFNCIIF